MHLSNLTGGTRQVGWVSSANARVLLLSLRKVEDLVAYCAQYEFEDVIASATRLDDLERRMGRLEDTLQRWMERLEDKVDAIAQK